MRATTICTAILLSLAAVACGPPSNGRGGNDDGVDASGGDDDPFPDASGTGCQKIDVLFVIDNSGSMAQEQTNLIANFPTFISVLDMSGLDYRVGVTTTGRDYTYNMTLPGIGTLPQSQTGGDNGKLLHPAACNMTHPWIDKLDPNASTTFQCVANVGTGGPGDEMPLGAVRDAFEERIADGSNAGFHRPDALLALVILTDENDCSYEQSVTLSFSESLCDSMMEPTANYVSFLDTYAGNRSKWATAVIAGKGPGSCSSTFGDAAEATRLNEFVTATGTNAIMSSICDGDLSIGLAQGLALFQSACGGIIF
jgi:hypothetical protein